MVFFLIVIAVLLAAGAILAYVYIQHRGNRKPAGEAGAQMEGSSSRVLWDAAEGGRGPVIRKGDVCLDRRSFLHRMTAAAMALVGFAAASEVGRVVHGATISSGAGESGGEGHHGDSPHYDHTGKHTDITCDPPQCTSSQHADGTPHSDRAHIDNPNG
jgi:hypothetical protein